MVDPLIEIIPSTDEVMFKNKPISTEDAHLFLAENYKKCPNCGSREPVIYTNVSIKSAANFVQFDADPATGASRMYWNAIGAYCNVCGFISHFTEGVVNRWRVAHKKAAGR